MKLLKLTFAAALLMSATMAFAINPNSALNKAAAKQNLYSSVQTNLTDHGITHELERKSTEQMAIYCHVDKNSNIIIDKLYGDNEELKKDIKRIMAKYPLKASKLLIGEPLAFKLTFKIL